MCIKCIHNNHQTELNLVLIYRNVVMPRIALKLPLAMLFSLFLIFLYWFFIVTCRSGFVSATASNRYCTWIEKRSGLDWIVEAIFIMITQAKESGTLDQTLNFHLNLYKVILFCLFVHLYIRNIVGIFNI